MHLREGGSRWGSAEELEELLIALSSFAVLVQVSLSALDVGILACWFAFVIIITDIIILIDICSLFINTGFR